MSDPHYRGQEIRDAVHGFVKLSWAEMQIVNCPTFQRLRDIRQLATAHLVYPGATHTRFEHSIGCVHLTSLIYDAIKSKVDQDECPSFAQAFGLKDDLSDRGERVLRLAALLHDLGHPPFSHCGENLMPMEERNGEMRRVSHEDMTARLIRETEIKTCIEEHWKRDGITAEEVIAVATDPKLANDSTWFNTPWYMFLNQLLTGELGSDRMDYLLRDAHHSGQEGGRFDYRKLIDSMTIVKPPEETSEGYRLGVHGDGWLVAEQMVAARYLMYVALYFHKTKRIYEMHLEDFMAAWLEKEFGKPQLPVGDINEYKGLTDSRVLGALYREGYATPGKNDARGLRVLADPFVTRQHFRLCCELILTDNHFERDKKRVWDKERLDKLEEDVSMQFGPEKIRAISVKHSAMKFLSDTHQIWVSLGNRTRHLGELSEIVRGMPDHIWRGRIYAHADCRDEVTSFCEDWLENHGQGGAL